MTAIKVNYYHCYATANDDRFYFRDIQNLIRIKRNSSGVDKLYFFMAISKATNIKRSDQLFVWAVKKFLSANTKIVVREIFFKSNLGRDFSSYAQMSGIIQKEANPNDYVFFQNRSGFGPFRNNWFKEIYKQFNKYNLVALCGSTINFKDHPRRSDSTNLAHVQTYAFLTQVSFLEMMRNRFPAEEECSRLNIILKGEIGLSQFFIKRGYGITCMEWPDVLVMKETDPVIDSDVKDQVIQEHQFYHKTYILKKEKHITSFQKLFNFIDFLMRSWFEKKSN